jgi:Fe-S-cluster containining protein
MTEFIKQNNEIELDHYDPGTTLRELSEELDAFRLTSGLKSGGCKGCGGCCSDNIPVLGPDIDILLEGFGMSLEQASRELFIMPEKPDIQARRKAIREMSDSAAITQLEATLLFEYNNAEPIILAKQTSGECCLLKDRLCSRYAIRPYSCGLYLCDMGERLSYIQEMIIRQGTWYAYAKLGWIDEGEIPHNPFLKRGSYDELLVSDFEFKLENTLDQLFFYF